MAVSTDNARSAAQQTEAAEEMSVVIVAEPGKAAIQAMHAAPELTIHLNGRRKPITVPVPLALCGLPISDPRVQSWIASYLMALRYKPDAFRALSDPGSTGVLGAIARIEPRPH